MKPSKSEGIRDRKRMFYSAFVPFVFILAMGMVKLAELTLGLDLTQFGVLPREVRGLSGILLCPFLHEDLWHLFSNAVPFFLFLTGIFYFFPRVAFRILLLVWVLTGFYVWLGGRVAWHIGASGLVYGFAGFLFTSGIIARDNRMLALTLIITFLYGNMIWGVLPIWKKISWESHLMGMLTGVVLAFIYRDEGPARPVYAWELEDDEGWEEPSVPETPATDQPPMSSTGPPSLQPNFEWKEKEKRADPKGAGSPTETAAAYPGKSPE